MSDGIHATLHLRVVYPPKISVETLYGWLVQVYQTARIQVRLGSSESLDLSEFYDVDAGDCLLDGSVTPQIAALHSNRTGVPPLDPVVYFVRSVGEFNACASHTKDIPACVISTEVWPWTMAHELGHVFGLKHTDASHNLMYGYGVENITNPPPVLTDAQRAIIGRSLYVHCDTPEMARVRTLLSSDAPASEIAASLAPDAHRILKALADLPDPVMASKAIYATRFIKSPEADRLAKEKLTDPRHVVRLAAARALRRAVHEPVNRKLKPRRVVAKKTTKTPVKVKRKRI